MTDAPVLRSISNVSSLWHRLMSEIDARVKAEQSERSQASASEDSSLTTSLVKVCVSRIMENGNYRIGVSG